MASLYISEYEEMPHTSGSKIPVALEAEITNQKVTIAGASAQSAALNARTRFVRLHTDAICSVKFGTDPTAAATDKRMAANATEYFGVPMGANYKIAVITNT